MSAEDTKKVEIKDPYAVLGVSKLADEDEFKAKYYILVKKYSPEYYPDEFIQVRSAYDILKDPTERAKIDICLFNPAPEIEFHDYPRREAKTDHDHHLSLFKLNQELQQILGDRSATEAMQDEIDPISHILRGKVVYYCDKERWSEAEDILQILAQLNPDHEDYPFDLRKVRWMEAYQLAKQENWEESGKIWFALFNELEGKPFRDLWRLTQNLALVASRRVDRENEDRWWKESLELWNQHLKREPNDEYVKGLIIALHHLTGGRLLGGKESFAGEIGLSGSGKELGLACMQRGNWTAAVEAFESVLNVSDNDVDLLCQLGWAYLNTNQIPKAFHMWNRAKKLAPNQESVTDHLVRGNLTVARRLREQRINNQALVHFKNVIRYRPEDENVRMELAETLMDMRNYQAAAKEAEKLLEINPRHKSAKQLMRDAKRLGNLR